MNREIKFRGKSIILNDWIYGGYVYDVEWAKGYIYRQEKRGAFFQCAPTEIDNNTVGQFTGLKDLNGVDIYEGDIIKCHEYDSSDTGKRVVQTFENAVVGFASGSFYYYPNGNMMQPHQLLMYAYKPVVIGNIHNNLELIS